MLKGLQALQSIIKTKGKLMIMQLISLIASECLPTKQFNPYTLALQLSQLIIAFPTVAIMRLVSIRIIFGSTEVLLIMLLVHAMGIFLSVLLGLDLVELVHALGLGEPVNLASYQTGNNFFGKGVVDRFTWVVSMLLL